jgi:beta-lactamase class A
MCGCNPQSSDVNCPIMLEYNKVFAVVCAGWALGGTVMATAASPAPQGSRAMVVANERAVQAEIRRVAMALDGVIGVAAWRLDGHGSPVLFNADETFPMASTFKVAVAGAVLDKVERHELSLEQMISIEPDQMIVSEILADRFIHPGVSISVYNLLELMLTESDNTATDLLVAAVGGAEAVTSWVRKQGVEAFRVDGTTDAILRRFVGLPREGSFPAALAAAIKSDPDLESKTLLPNPDFDDDPRDSATPRAMGQLLHRMFGGKALDKESTAILTAMMERCRTGQGRLAGRMPPGTVVAHKTGTLGGTVNDVGVVGLPDDGGRFVIVVFLKKSAAPVEQRERAIAEIGRSIRDYYLFGG